MAANTLTENLKKYFYTSIGLASHTGEIVQHSIDEFIKKGKLNEEDGKKIIDSALKKLDTKMPHFEKRYREAVDKALKFANTEIARLQKKVSTLEAKKGPATAKRQAKSTPKKAVRKVARKRKVTKGA